MTSNAMQLQQYMQSKGCLISTPPVADGALHRFHVKGDAPRTQNGWYLFFDDGMVCAAFGSWKDDSSAWERWSLRSESEWTPQDKKLFRQKMDEAKRIRQAEQEERWAACRAATETLWEMATIPESHPYLDRKKIKAHDIRLFGGELIIPVFSADGILRGCQKISDTSKLFEPGTQKKGGFHIIGGKPNGHIIIAEGYATAAAIFEATGIPTVVAFDAGNILPVAEEISRIFPQTKMVFAADNDWHRPENPGITKSTEAANRMEGIVVTPPQLPGKGTDFNDLFIASGKQAVADLFKQVLEPAPQEEATPDVGKLPENLLNPGGLLQEITDWINRGAIKQQPILALGASIAAMGTLMGRQVATESNLRTNVFVVGVGETSCGKEHARSCIRELFIEAGRAELIGPEDLASDSGLLKEVYAHPVQLIQIDEIGWFFKTMTSGYAKPHISNIAPTLMKIHSSAGGVLIGKGYADTTRKRADIPQPCVSLYGTSVPSRLHAALTKNEVEDGFIPRLIVLESEDPSPKRSRVRHQPPSEELISMVQQWNPNQLSNTAGLLIPPRVVYLTDQAHQCFDDFEEYVREQREKMKPLGIAGLWGKTEATAWQLALIHACSLDPYATEISVTSALWAIQLMIHTTLKMCRMAEKNLAANEYEASVNFVMKIVCEYGREGINRKQLQHRCTRFHPRLFEDILTTLEESGQIIRDIRKNIRGKSSTIIKMS